MKFINDILTGKDNVTYDAGRVGFFVGVGAYVAATFCAIYQGTKFDWVAFGTGYSAILAAYGVALGLAAKTEPEPKKDC